MRRWIGILSRLSRHAGRRFTLGGRKYRLRGYLANALDLSPAHEPAVRHAIDRILKERKGAFIDVGINNGQSFLKLLGIDPDRTYVGFEPQLLCCASMMTFIVENGLKDKYVLPIALGEEATAARLYFRRLTDESASLHTAILPGAPYSCLIWSARGDDVLKHMGIDDVALIKVDVEGHEKEVLSGLGKTLERTFCPVVFEVIPNFAGPEGPVPAEDRDEIRTRASALWSLLENLGYRIFSIDDAGGEREVSRFEIDEPKGYAGHNYLALHPSCRTQ